MSSKTHHLAMFLELYRPSSLIELKKLAHCKATRIANDHDYCYSDERDRLVPDDTSNCKTRLPSLSNICYVSKGKTRYLEKISGFNSVFVNSGASPCATNSGCAINASDANFRSVNSSAYDIYQQESNYFQLSMIENEILFINLWDKHKCNVECYLLWMMHTKHSKNEALYAIAEPNDRFNHGQSQNNQNDSMYPYWKLESIMTSEQVLSFFLRKNIIELEYKYNSQRYITSESNKYIIGQQLMCYLPSRIDLFDNNLQFNPNLPIEFNFDKIMSNLQSKSNIKKYESFVNDIKQLKCKNFDGLFNLMLISMYNSLLFSKLYPQFVHKQIYIDKYNATYHCEFVILLEIKNMFIKNKVHKYGLTLIVNNQNRSHDFNHKGCYILNCINSGNIALSNIQLASQLANNYDSKHRAMAVQMYGNSAKSFYDQIGEKRLKNVYGNADGSTRRVSLSRYGLLNVSYQTQMAIISNYKSNSSSVDTNHPQNGLERGTATTKNFIMTHQQSHHCTGHTQKTVCRTRLCTQCGV